MKHIFVVNPLAGKKGRDAQRILPEIDSYCQAQGLDYQIYCTKAAGDGLDFVKKTAAKGEDVRFYACGGDGTLFEVVNGSFGYDNVEVAALPLGSGNDFIRLFGTKEQLANVEAQVNGTVIKLDLIKCGDKIAINECSMGMDAEVCKKQADFKKLPFISGEMAYTFSALWALMKKMENTFTISVDDKPAETRKVIFCFVGNSRWYGGGYMGGPLAMPNDGLLDIVVVEKKVSRLKLLTLLSAYKQGKQLSWDFTHFVRGKKITVHAQDPAVVNVDGECEVVHDCTMEIVPSAIKFVVPANSTFFADVESGRISSERPINA
ncbi:MAG: diacylglycerol/lipid kinase family protein [Acutalibacteraceae bacterium]